MEFTLDDGFAVGIFPRLSLPLDNAIHRASPVELRRCLRSAGVADAWRLNDDELKDEVLKRIRQGDLVAVRDAGVVTTNRWGTALRSHHEQIRLLPRSVIQATHGHALIWLNSLPAMKDELKTVKRVFNPTRAEGIEDESDADYLERLTKEFHRGEVIVLAEARYRFAEDVADSPSFEPGPAAARSEPPPVEDPATFEPGHSVAQQVQTLTTAAEHGIAACEICQQLAAARQGQ